ncbi:zinc finger protein 26 isoform X1 [Stomoxys calcitrans]|uniref:zinc finger protein 26 isoform X1 n=1 Tax=Stomoxys calcitrans TaxID=35570 RepID=UPI0027E35636|nr:zinc finger protein 26 isoform X1 [Stomoxys calcitrans]XP_013109967.2 zinc finger protein 26 isoform X1 [Stomoxys calcitrans]
MSSISLSSTLLCRLCLKSCVVYNHLYKDNQEKSNVYSIASKYFGPQIIDSSHGQPVICTECWLQIKEFHQFKQTVVGAHFRISNLCPKTGMVKSGVPQKVFVIAHKNVPPGDDTKYYDIYVVDDDNYTPRNVVENIGPHSSPNEINVSQQTKEGLRSDEFVIQTMDLDINSQAYQLGKANEHMDIDYEKKHAEQRRDEQEYVPERNIIDPLSLCQIEVGTEGIKGNVKYTSYLSSVDGKFYTVAEEDSNQNNGEEIYHAEDKTLEIQKARRRVIDLENEIALLFPELPCLHCETKCVSFKLLQDHYSLYHPNERCFVICCNYNFFRRSDLADHVAVHLNKVNHKSDKTGRKNFKSEAIKHNRCPRTNPHKQEYISKLDLLLEQMKINLQCGLCNTPCPSFKHMKYHFRVKHEDDITHIVCCGQKIYDYDHIAEHMLRHQEVKGPFVCEVCHMSFEEKSFLNDHMVMHVSSIYNSQREQEELETVSSNKAPQEKVTTNKRRCGAMLDYDIAQWMPDIQCLHCEVTCKSFALLQEHYRENHPEHRCVAACCKYKFSRKSELAEHIRYHLNPKEFTCEKCGKSLRDRKSLEKYHVCPKHIRTLNRSSAKNTLKIDALLKQLKISLECGLCNRLSPNYKLLLAHYRLKHSNEEFQGVCCGIQFLNENSIEEHILNHQELKGNYVCNTCQMSFVRETHLNAHMDAHKNTPIGGDEEENCEQTLPEIGALSADYDLSADDEPSENELEKRPTRRSVKELDNAIAKWMPILQCEYCGKTFKTYTLLLMHHKLHHSARRCYVECCQVQFMYRNKLAEHVLQAHINPKAYICKICNIQLSCTFGLKDHMQRCHFENSKYHLKRLEALLGRMQVSLECGECRRPCSTYKLLQSHFRDQHTDKTCHIVCCEKMFNQPKVIREHMLLHRKLTNNFKCPICPMSFKWEMDLNYHVDVHSRPAIDNAKHTGEESTIISNASTSSIKEAS